MQYISKDNIKNVVRATSPQSMFVGDNWGFNQNRPKSGGNVGQRRSKKDRTVSNFNEELTGFFSNSSQQRPNKNRFESPPPSDIIGSLTMKIFNKYDKDRSGFLDKGETLKMLDEILINQGRPKTTIS